MKSPGLTSGASAFNSTNTSANYTTKKFPPFGKRFDAMRRKDLIPAMRVIVATDWKLGAAYPRIVVTRDQPVTSLRFEYLAGLHVQIVYYDHDASILPNLTAEIQLVNPATLAVFNMSAAKRGDPAYTMIYSQSEMEEIAA
ncbi:MAG: hypothetical protein EBU46_02415 [Nitrosomonadaceae bacterium]|nr:hypothetical protein [Nitrosomonadaceae bacterium]